MTYRLYRLPPSTLNNREREVAGLLADGRTTNEIAAALGISAATTRQYIMRAAEKVGAADRWQLVRWVRERRSAA